MKEEPERGGSEAWEKAERYLGEGIRKGREREKEGGKKYFLNQFPSFQRKT